MKQPKPEKIYEDSNVYIAKQIREDEVWYIYIKVPEQSDDIAYVPPIVFAKIPLKELAK